MARSKEEMQDIALYHMEKQNRHSKGERINPTPTLAEQLAELERSKKMSRSEKLREMTPQEWNYELKTWTRKKEIQNRYGFGGNFTSWLFSHKRKKLDEFHTKGTTFTEMVPWLKEMQEEYINF